MQAVLLTSSLLLVVAMLGSLLWLSAVRPRPGPVDAAEDTV